MSAQPIFESALRALNLAHDGTPPRHEYLAALAADRAGTPEPHDDDAAGNEARAAEEEQGARKCAELIGRYGAEDPSDARDRVVARLTLEMNAHLLNATAYRRIAASICRRQARFQQAAE